MLLFASGDPLSNPGVVGIFSYVRTGNVLFNFTLSLIMSLVGIYFFPQSTQKAHLLICAFESIIEKKKIDPINDQLNVINNYPISNVAKHSYS